MTITTTKRTTDHPSDRLHRGEVHDFTEAVSVFKASIAWERAWHRRFCREVGDEACTNPSPEHLLNDDELQADRALAIYAETMANAQRAAVVALRLADLTEFADALDAGDYRGLAL